MLLLIAVLSVVAGGAVAWVERLDQVVQPVSELPLLGLLVALTASAYLHVELRHGDDDVDALDLFEAALAPALFLLPAAQVVGLVVVAKVIAQVLLRVQAVKAAFNVAAWSAAAAVGSLLLAALGGPRPVDGGDLLVLTAAMVAVMAVDQVAYICVLRLADRRTFRDVIAELRPAIVPAWLVGGGVTLSFGLLFAAACSREPAVAWLLPVPLGALHWASQTYAMSRAALARAEGLHRASRALVSSQEPKVAIDAFLDNVRASFQADAADLVTADRHGVSVQRAGDPRAGAGLGHVGPGQSDGDGERAVAAQPDLQLAAALLELDEGARVTVLSSDPVIAAGLRRHGWRDCMVAPVSASGGTRRALCVYEPRGIRAFDRVDLGVLDGLAGELGGALARRAEITERERAAALVSGQAEVLRSISRRSPIEETVEALGRSIEPQAPGSRYTVVLFGEPGSSVTVMGSPLPSPLIDELAGAFAPEGGPEEADAPRPFLIVEDVDADARCSAAVGDEGIRAVWAAPIKRSGGAESLGLAVLHFLHPRTADPSDLRVLASAAELTHIAVEAVAAQTRLVHQATHDALTGLPNRVLFIDRTTVALSRLVRSSMSVAVLFVDLDRFKSVNDSLGHDVGDRLLVALAGRLKAAMRPSDTVARFGGDEFTILCEDIHDEDEAVAIAVRLRAVLAAPTRLEGHDLFVTASVGIAHTADHRRVPQELVEDADAAMYQAKRSGGDVHEVRDRAARGRALRDLVTHQALRKAIDRGELLVHYQPTVDLDTGRIVGAEALVRWDHPDHGLVGAADFVPLAEETGLIVPLGTLVLNEACRQQRRWLEAAGGEAGFTMSVNLSPRQFADPRLPETVAAALASSGASAGALALEITESALMEHADATLVALHALKALGVRIAIDDFGTGYSSLMYLKRFPVDIIKVDRAFVEGLGRGPGDEAIVGAVVQLAHSLGMQAVAEGVETDEQVQRLRALRCDVGQGYRFGRPVPAGEGVLWPTQVIDLRVPDGDRHP